MSSEAKEAGGAGEAAARATGAGGSTPMPTWLMPRALPDGLGFWDTAYPLKVMNSLTRTKVPFIPMEGKRVLWYMCGPTVYDSAHLGHARTYLGFDIIRRIMTDYFGYDVLLAMNITDIDDKIIMRSNERGIPFTELSRTFETEFLEDMLALNVRPVDFMPRVSEHVPEVIAYIQQIVDNGFGYESNGSVYFDTQAYAATKHVYGKLVPENVGDAEATAEGEGALSVSAGAKDKKHGNDFALWKASKAGEPSWESPWGAGRPGWHIECSAMSTKAFRDFSDGHIDIHSGGTDLRFPHHENEIAQAEAHFDFSQWINYWVHTGHLHIKGLKMSKSLKNFITIRQALGKYSARQIRYLFLQYRYNAPMDFSDASLMEAETTERAFDQFFGNMRALLRRHKAAGPARWNDVAGEEADDRDEHALALTLMTVKARVRAALCDDFDTPTTMRALRDLVTAMNKYRDAKDAAGEPPVPYLVRAGVEYVAKILKVFGLAPEPEPGIEAEGGAGGGASREATMAPVLDAFAEFRDEVRAAARAGDAAEVLKATDKVRDSTMAKLGVVLEDGKDGHASTWKLVPQEQLEREAALAAEKKAEEAARKAEARAAAEARKAAAAAAARVDPRAMFREGGPNYLDGDKPLYSKWDEDGVPTHDADGAALSDKKVKKLRKVWEGQKKKFDKATGAGGGGGGAGDA